MHRPSPRMTRYIAAMLITMLLVLLAGYSQAQQSYNISTASAHERALKLDLWDQLYAEDFECLMDLTPSSVRKWCGAIFDDLVAINQRIVERVFADYGYMMLNDKRWQTERFGDSLMYTAGFFDFSYTMGIFYYDMGEAGYIELVTIEQP